MPVLAEFWQRLQRKKVVKEVSEGLYSSASLTYGEEDGQKEPSDLDEPCGQEDPCYIAPYIVLPPLTRLI